VVVIPHGVSAPRVRGTASDAQREALRAELGWAGKVVIAGNGLIHPEKGYEHVIKAMPRLVARWPHTLLVIIGVAHSNNKAGQAYVSGLVSLVSALHLNQTVLFMPQYLPYKQLTNVLQAADVFVHPTNDPEVASSGTLSMAMSCGLAPMHAAARSQPMATCVRGSVGCHSVEPTHGHACVARLAAIAWSQAMAMCAWLGWLLGWLLLRG
jgi:glycosyltransferase involved in cell wall biosynthesis